MQLAALTFGSYLAEQKARDLPACHLTYLPTTLSATGPRHLPVLKVLPPPSTRTTRLLGQFLATHSSTPLASRYRPPSSRLTTWPPPSRQRRGSPRLPRRRYLYGVPPTRGNTDWILTMSSSGCFDTRRQEACAATSVTSRPRETCPSSRLPRWPSPKRAASGPANGSTRTASRGRKHAPTGTSHAAEPSPNTITGRGSARAADAGERPRRSRCLTAEASREAAEAQLRVVRHEQRPAPNGGGEEGARAAAPRS
jgi:hypothetical protein